MNRLNKNYFRRKIEQRYMQLKFHVPNEVIRILRLAEISGMELDEIEQAILVQGEHHVPA
jgi:hypothetical protein